MPSGTPPTGRPGSWFRGNGMPTTHTKQRGAKYLNPWRSEALIFGLAWGAMPTLASLENRVSDHWIRNIEKRGEWRNTDQHATSVKSKLCADQLRRSANAEGPGKTSTSALEPPGPPLPSRLLSSAQFGVRPRPRRRNSRGSRQLLNGGRYRSGSSEGSRAAHGRRACRVPSADSPLHAFQNPSSGLWPRPSNRRAEHYWVRSQ
jgi:hypothetical protein